VIESGMEKKRWLVLAWALLASPTLHAQNTIGEVFASDASVRGSVVLSGNGMGVLSGSQVSAGDAAAILKLARGGEVRICPKTNVSLSADANGKALVLGINQGALEVDYPLQGATDSLLTPYFRLQLISPGTFHFAISVASSGDTCLRTLPGNDAAVFVAEMMGTESYQLTPGKSVLFKAGKISGAMEAPKTCGCPEIKVEQPKAALEVPAPMETAKETPVARETGEEHMQVDTSFVYRGTQTVQDFSMAVSRLSRSSDNSSLAVALMPTVHGPVAAQPTTPQGKKPGVIRRFAGFVARLFSN